jgi:hypothetical protein
MLWRQALSVAVLIGAAGMSPVAAQTTASISLVVAPADSAWPAIVPRLASYTAAQKAAITDVVQQYCTEHRVAKRSELQAKIQKLLAREQVIEAIRYWLPQNVQHDFRGVAEDRPRKPEELDACDRPVRLG